MATGRGSLRNRPKLVAGMEHRKHTHYAPACATPCAHGLRVVGRGAVSVVRWGGLVSYPAPLPSSDATTQR